MAKYNKRPSLHERYADSAAVLAHMQNVGPMLPDFFACVEMESIVVLGDCTDDLKQYFLTLGLSMSIF